MPVLDHAIHPSTQIGEGYRYGCWNLPRTRYGYHHRGRFVRDVMSKECRYDMSLTDPFCKGCRWAGSGEKYAQMMKEQAQ